MRIEPWKRSNTVLRCRRFIPLLMLVIGQIVSATTWAADAARPPNLVVILMDDMGWRDVGFMGNSFVETPHIDRLAKSGLIFTQAYASAPNCAPTRACLLSGQYTPRHGIYTVVDPRQPVGSAWHKLTAAESKSELDTNIVTIAEALRGGVAPQLRTESRSDSATSYATAFFGMWNLGRGRTGPVTPGGQGFQKVVFPENLKFGKDEYFDDDGNYLSDRLTDEVLSFVNENRERPFFVYLADHAVHAPYNPKPDLLKKYEKKLASSKDKRDDPKHSATVEAVDHNVGRIVESLAKLKLTDNTYVVFTSDNGGTDRYTPPLNGGKGQLYEGGIRVLLAITGPGIKQPGSKTDVPVASIDLYPTLLELSGLPAPIGQVQDGLSMVPLLKGEQTLKRERLFWHFPCYVGKSTPASALREGEFKLIEYFEDGGYHELYNLKSDPSEERNLAKSMPDKAASMLKTLRAWQAETGALKPTGPNPNYDPKADRPRGGQGGNAGGNNPNKGNGSGSKKKNKRAAATRTDDTDPVAALADDESPTEIGSLVKTDSGFLLWNGTFVSPPYTVLLTALGVEINGTLVLRFDANAKPQLAAQRFDNLVNTLTNDDLVLAFDEVDPILFRSASFEPLSQLLRRPIPAEFLTDIGKVSSQITLDDEQRAKWQHLLTTFVPTAEFANRAESALRLMENNEREHRATRRAQWLLDRTAYPLTVAAMVCVALAAGHLLSRHSQLLASSPSGVSGDHDRAVKTTLAYIVAFSALDLVWTILASQGGQMRELHPLGSDLTENPLLLVGFKIAATSVCVGLLFMLRHRPAARKASWHVCLICLLLAGRWITVGGLLI